MTERSFLILTTIHNTHFVMTGYSLLLLRKETFHDDSAKFSINNGKTFPDNRAMFSVTNDKIFRDNRAKFSVNNKIKIVMVGQSFLLITRKTFCAGQRVEAEGNDRPDLNLPGQQTTLLADVINNSMVFVLSNSSIHNFGVLLTTAHILPSKTFYTLVWCHYQQYTFPPTKFLL